MSYTDTHVSSNAYLIISVVFVCCLTVLFSSYKILLKFCSTFPRVRNSRNWNRRRTLLNEANHDDPSLQFHSQGLDFSIIRSLPVAQFKKKSEAEVSENSRSNTDCPVCLGEFEEGEWLRHLPKCSHAFHISCIDTWFVSHSNCPLCRSEVFDFMQDCPIPMHTLVETLRESVIQDRVLHYQMLRSTILANSPLGRETRMNGDHNV